MNERLRDHAVVEITDESLIPDDLCTVTVMFRGHEWKMLCEEHGAELASDSVGPRVPSLSLIVEVLKKPCPKCKGIPAVRYSTEGVTDEPGGTEGVAVCPECDGSGTQSVPGARLVVKPATRSIGGGHNTDGVSPR